MGDIDWNKIYGLKKQELIPCARCKEHHKLVEFYIASNGNKHNLMIFEDEYKELCFFCLRDELLKKREELYPYIHEYRNINYVLNQLHGAQEVIEVYLKERDEHAVLMRVKREQTKDGNH